MCLLQILGKQSPTLIHCPFLSRPICSPLGLLASVWLASHVQGLLVGNLTHIYLQSLTLGWQTDSSYWHFIPQRVQRNMSIFSPSLYCCSPLNIHSLNPPRWPPRKHTRNPHVNFTFRTWNPLVSISSWLCSPPVHTTFLVTRGFRSNFCCPRIIILFGGGFEAMD